MILYIKLKAHRGGREAVKGDNTRVLCELTYKNKKIGTIGLYSIIDDKVEGYRVVWDDLKGFKADGSNIIAEEIKEKGKTQNNEQCYCECNMSVPHYH